MFPEIASHALGLDPRIALLLAMTAQVFPVSAKTLRDFRLLSGGCLTRRRLDNIRSQVEAAIGGYKQVIGDGLRCQG